MWGGTMLLGWDKTFEAISTRRGLSYAGFVRIEATPILRGVGVYYMLKSLFLVW